MLFFVLFVCVCVGGGGGGEWGGMGGVGGGGVGVAMCWSDFASANSAKGAGPVEG